MFGASMRAETEPVSAVPALHAIRDPVWLEAVRLGKEHVHPGGVVVMRPTDSCNDFLIVLQGRVRVYRTDEGGREIVLYRVCAGEACILTLCRLTSGIPYNAYAVTEKETRLLAISRTHFHRVMARSEAFREYIFSELARRLSDLMQLVEQVAFCTLNQRLASLLGQLGRQRHSSTLRITHQEIARELGTSREVASRLLKEFERKGCVRLQRGCIEILSPELLAGLARG